MGFVTYLYSNQIYVGIGSGIFFAQHWANQVVSYDKEKTGKKRGDIVG